MDARRIFNVVLMALVLAGAAALYACDTECDKAYRELAKCCNANPVDAGTECLRLNQQTFVDASDIPDVGPDGSYDAGQPVEVACEGTWLDYARSVLDKGLDPATCTVKP